jgi:hypothetical protein
MKLLDAATFVLVAALLFFPAHGRTSELSGL